MSTAKTTFRRINYGSRIAIGAIVMTGLFFNIGPTPVMLVMTLFAIPAVLSGFLGWNIQHTPASSAPSQHKAPVLSLVPPATQRGQSPMPVWRQAA